MPNNDNAVRTSISNYISSYLERTKMPKAQFGKLFGVSATSVTRWIECVCAPDIELIPKLSEVMNVSIPELLGAESGPALKPDDVKLIKEYAANVPFKDLVNRYLNDESFRKSIDYIVSLKN